MDRPLERSPYSASAVPLTAGPPASSPPSLSPLHSASVHVTDFPLLTNPAPVGRGWEGQRKGGQEERFRGDYLSPMKLRELSGETDLGQVRYLEVSVNSQSCSLGNFGSSLPALAELRCVDSVVPCVRDLGTGLIRLTVLWLSRCGLRDLDGLPSLSSLKELYISFNEVSDVSVAAMLSSLQVLDMESNQVREEDQLGYLGLCWQLSSLTLTGNPLAQRIAEQQGGEVGYRAAVLKALPQLTVLDDISVSEHTPLSTGLSSQSVQLSTPDRADKGWDRISPLPTRPRTSLSPGRAGHISPVEDDSSDLTHGMSQVICGNPARALKARRRRGLASQSAVTPSPSSANSASLDALMEELSVIRATSVEDLSLITDSPSPAPLPPSSPAPLPPTSYISLHYRGLPSPPSSSAIQHRVHKILPSPPSSESTPTRPHSVADFRLRRYRKAAPHSIRRVTRSVSEHAPSGVSSHPPSHTTPPLSHSHHN